MHSCLQSCRALLLGMVAEQSHGGKSLLVSFRYFRAAVVAVLRNCVLLLYLRLKEPEL